MTEPDCQEVLDRLPTVPDSSKTVLCTLYGNRPMTAKELREATGLPRRTLYTALQRLKEAGAVDEQVSLRDSRQTFYWVRREVVEEARHGLVPGHGGEATETPAH